MAPHTLCCEDEIPMAAGPERHLPPTSRGRLQNSLHYLLKDPGNPWWDDNETPDKIERRDDILVEATRKAYRDGVKKPGKNFKTWKWGKVHRAECQSGHPGNSHYDDLIEPGQMECEVAEENRLGAFLIHPSLNRGHSEIAFSYRDAFTILFMGYSSLTHLDEPLKIFSPYRRRNGEHGIILFCPGIDNREARIETESGSHRHVPCNSWRVIPINFY